MGVAHCEGLRAPVAGIVNRLHRRTIGGAVRAGEEVAAQLQHFELGIR
jgi:predicted deacylase